LIQSLQRTSRIDSERSLPGITSVAAWTNSGHVEGSAMHVKLGAAVLDKNQVEVGRVERLVIDPGKRQIIQLVARHGRIDPKHHIIESNVVNHVDAEGKVHLNLTESEVSGLREFYSVNYTKQSYQADFSWSQAVGTPLGGPIEAASAGSTQYTTLPDNVVVVTKGMDVQDKDFEKFGEIEDIEFGQQAVVTGFTVRSGGMLRHDYHYLPVEHVVGVGTDYVRVNLTGDEARAMPARAASD
jgi:uncharacterized protein YrrD